jgi:hypothetical protein
MDLDGSEEIDTLAFGGADTLTVPRRADIPAARRRARTRAAAPAASMASRRRPRTSARSRSCSALA